MELFSSNWDASGESDAYNNETHVTKTKEGKQQYLSQIDSVQHV